MPGGRKSLKDELEITRRYADLTEPAFRLISQKLASDNREDQNFALDWLKGGFTKMIPQQVTGANGGPIQVQMLTAEQEQALNQLTLPNVNTSSTGQSNQGDDSGTPILD